MKNPSSNTWACPAGCAVTAEPCKHLEALLPGAYAGDAKRRLSYSAHIERNGSGAPSPEDLLIEAEEEHSAEDLEPGAELEALRQELASFGLKAKQFDVIVARLVDRKTFPVIANEQGYSSRSSAMRAFDNAIAFLKARGYTGRRSVKA